MNINPPLINTGISPETYFLYESLSFKSEESSVTEIAKLIPIVSFFVEIDDIRTSLKNRTIYLENPDKYIYDYRISEVYIASKIINAIGLGILILPARFIVTILKSFDEDAGKTCFNPHKLDTLQMMICQGANNRSQTTYEYLVNAYHDNPDLAAKQALRDNVKYPESCLNSLYKDPLLTDDDREYLESRPVVRINLSEELRKIKKQMWSRTDVDSEQ